MQWDIKASASLFIVNLFDLIELDLAIDFLWSTIKFKEWYVTDRDLDDCARIDVKDQICVQRLPPLFRAFKRAVKKQTTFVSRRKPLTTIIIPFVNKLEVGT